MPPVSSNVHGQLDAQIAQLTQCKPLPEHEVRLVSIGSVSVSVSVLGSSVLSVGLRKRGIQRWW